MKKIIPILSVFALSAQAVLFAADMQIKGKNLERLEAATPKTAAAKPQKQRNILVFSRTCGFRHEQGIPAAKLAFSLMGEKLGVWNAKISEDLADISPDKLSQYDCIVLNNTTGMCFGEPQPKMRKLPQAERAAVQKRSDEICKALVEYVRNGGGILAIHAAVDSYNYDPFRNREYTDMLGGEFVAHPWYLSNAPVTMVIDDTKSPLVKGVWDGEAFKLREEIYMLGKSYDRQKCRVLIRLDKSRSPLTTAARERKFAFRKDNDFATAYIKSFGKGRVAYTTMGHADTNYYNPQVQEFFLRMAQFACGDLKADTSSLPFTGKSVLAPMSEKPAVAQIEKLSDLKFGQPRDEEINGTIFAVYANNFDKKYCAEIEKFVLSALESKAGTPEYRAFLCELLWAAGISADANFARAQKLLSQKALEAEIASKLEYAAASYKPRAAKPERRFAVPETLPEDAAARTKLIKFLAKNPDAKIPQYLAFENLDEAGRAMLAYALLERGESAAQALKFAPKSEAFAVAYSAVLAKEGKPADIEKLLDAADFVSAQMRPVVVANLAAVKSKTLPEDLLALMAKATTPARSALIVDTLAKFELGALVSKIFADFDSMSPEMKQTSLRAAASIGNEEAFKTVAKLLPSLDAKLAREAVKTLLICAGKNFDSEMFAAAVDAYGACPKPLKKNLVRFAAFDCSPAAAEFAKRAFSDGFRAEAVKAFGQWKNQSALQPLAAIAKSAKTDDARDTALDALMNVASNCGFDSPTLSFVLSNGRESDKTAAAEIAVKFPSPEFVGIFEKAGNQAATDKIATAIKNVKTKYLACRNAGQFGLALDGDIKTRFTTGSTIGVGDWIAVDFGYPKKVSRFVFDLGSSKRDFPDVFSVYAGASESAMMKVAVEIKNENGKISVKMPDGTAARYVKFVAEKAKPYYWSIHEMKTE